MVKPRFNFEARTPRRDILMNSAFSIGTACARVLGRWGQVRRLPTERPTRQHRPGTPGLATDIEKAEYMTLPTAITPTRKRNPDPWRYA